MLKNIIFDIGNVILEWKPQLFLAKLLPPNIDVTTFIQQITPIWMQYDAGKVDEAGTIDAICKISGISSNIGQEMMQLSRTTLTPAVGSLELLANLHKTNQYNLFCITNMSIPTYLFLQKKYSFWKYFNNTIVSAHVKLLKPDLKIYNLLLENENLRPQQCLFIDDLKENIDAAKTLGLTGIQFTDAVTCIQELKALNISV